MRKSCLYVLFLALGLSSFGRIQQQVDGWLLEREKRGVKVFTKKSRWGKLKDSKAEMLLPNTNVDEMVRFLCDFDNYPNWIPRCREAKVLARVSDVEFIAYMVFKSPWPVADRDCVVRVKIERDPVTHSVLIRETSEPKYINSKSEVVRIEQMYATWRITPQSGGLMVVNETSTNPGGTIPDWMINTQSVDNPYDIFTTLQNKIAGKTALPKK